MNVKETTRRGFFKLFGGLLVVGASMSVLPASWWDADALEYIRAAPFRLNMKRKIAINQLFKDLKGTGNYGTENIFSKIDMMWLGGFNHVG